MKYNKFAQFVLTASGLIAVSAIATILASWAFNSVLTSFMTSLQLLFSLFAK
jgi:small-conductance mechanosensitive channel